MIHDTSDKKGETRHSKSEQRDGAVEVWKAYLLTAGGTNAMSFSIVGTQQRRPGSSEHNGAQIMPLPLRKALALKVKSLSGCCRTSTVSISEMLCTFEHWTKTKLRLTPYEHNKHYIL